jgi:hypothetical protein
MRWWNATGVVVRGDDPAALWIASMKTNIWLRIYTSILDPLDKSRKLSDRLFRQWIYILAAYKRNGAVMPDIRALAACLSVSVANAAKVLDALESAELLDRHEDGLTPHDWDNLQFESDTSRVRMARHRERHKKRHSDGVSDVTSDVTVTSPVTESPSVRNRVQRTENREQSVAGCVGTCGVVESASQTPPPEPARSWNGKLEIARAMLAAWPRHFGKDWPPPDDATCGRMLDAFAGDCGAMLAWLKQQAQRKRDPGESWGLVVTMAQHRSRGSK